MASRSKNTKNTKTAKPKVDNASVLLNFYTDALFVIFNDEPGLLHEDVISTIFVDMGTSKYNKTLKIPEFIPIVNPTVNDLLNRIINEFMKVRNDDNHNLTKFFKQKLANRYEKYIEAIKEPKVSLFSEKSTYPPTYIEKFTYVYTSGSSKLTLLNDDITPSEQAKILADYLFAVQLMACLIFEEFYVRELPTSLSTPATIPGITSPLIKSLKRWINKMLFNGIIEKGDFVYGEFVNCVTYLIELPAKKAEAAANKAKQTKPKTKETKPQETDNTIAEFETGTDPKDEEDF